MTRPTLILGSEPRIVIPIARSLSERDVKVTVATYGENAKKTRSRALHQFVVLPEPGDQPVKFCSTLKELICKEQFDFLVPCGDSALVAISHDYEQLTRLLKVSCPPPRILQRVLDKRQTLEIAEACGVSIPKTFWVSSIEEIEFIKNQITFPVVCKPSSKQRENAFKVRYFRSCEELKNAFTSGDALGKPVMLQQYCEGDGVGIETLIHEGEPIALFQHRRIRELPSTGGVSVLAISERLNPDLVRSALVLLRALEWEGVAMVEFKYNRSDRTAVLMEVNGRFWGSLGVSMQAGLNFPLYAWQLAHHEQPQVPSQYRSGLRVRWMKGELQRLHEMLFQSRREASSRESRSRELADFVLDLRPSTKDMLWSLSDPLPAFLEASDAILKLASDDIKRLLRRILPPRLMHHVRVSRKLGGGEAWLYLKLQASRSLGIRKDKLSRIPSGVSSVLFICHGNIIRSPLAAALLKEQLSNLNRNGIHVSSAGLHAKPGKSADLRAIIAARERGISLEDHRAQSLNIGLVRQADLIFVMDQVNEAQLLMLYPEARSKLFLLSIEGSNGKQTSAEITDPYAGDLSDVRQCCETIHSRISDLVSLLIRSNSSRKLQKGGEG